jgi:predicted metalloprotease with PDZ domain
VRRLLLAFGLLLHLASPAHAQAPVAYRVSFPEPEHHWMQIDATFPDLGAAPLQACMSRSSPGRYAVQEFAKNVYDVRAFDSKGRTLDITRPSPREWDVAGHDGTVRIAYKVYGDRIDGTFLSVDVTHAHINMPAALMWARGLENRQVRIRFEQPAGKAWKIATQLHPTDDPAIFAAANLQYLMDSPTELSDFTLRSFRVELAPARSNAPGGSRAATFRIAFHDEDSDEDAERFASDVERIVREEVAIYGEFPSYEGGTYTFLADYLPYATRDGMEHRNSTVMTSPGALRDPGQRSDLLATAAHEFFHCWNVERIRPRSLEPFNLEDANMSGELWLAEGFTSYYDALVMQRTGLASLAETVSTFGGILDSVVQSPARRFRSAVDMSRLAPFVDAASWIDRTNWDNTFISYYTWGAAIGLGLDLSLRERSKGAVTLDDYMRAMWQTYGRVPGPAEGLVGSPYTLEDARNRLADVSGDRAFAVEFFDRFVEGREVVDYGRLLARAGLVWRLRNPGRAWIGQPRFDFSLGAGRLVSPALIDTPIYRAGLDQDDDLMMLDGERMSSADRLDAVLRRHKPGDRLNATIRRRGVQQSVIVVVGEDPHQEIVPVEDTGRQILPAERAFRDAWLQSRR